MIHITEIEVGDWLRFKDGSGPVKVVGLWPFSVELEIQPNLKPWSECVVNSDTRMINMKPNSQLRKLLYQ